MNIDFPRILTLLRKERGISQKQAAADLNVSQALLSHYEKGIRECGLDFVVRTADFYNISCDYLLGRSPERTGATLAIEDIPEFNFTEKDSGEQLSSITNLNKKLIFNSLNVVFDMLDKVGNANLSSHSSAFLMLSVYSCFRQLYSINQKNETTMFTVAQNVSSALCISKMLSLQAQIRIVLDNPSNKKENRIDTNCLAISSESLQQDYPAFTSSLLNLVKASESYINL